MDAPKPKKPPKPRSLPPPGEAFERARPKVKAKALPKAKAAAKKPVAAKKTPAKLKPSPASGNDAGQGAGQVKAGNGVTKQAPGKKGKQAKTKVPSIWDFVKHESVGTGGSFSASRKKPERESVLMRPTAMTKQLKEKHAGGKNAKKMAKSSVNTEAKGEAKVFRVMDLPEELRITIWRHAVVYPHFVWPEERRGQEQPDLTMTCRQVRHEALSIFYAENIFAIDITKYKRIVPFIQKWACALQGTNGEPGWFSMIRKWSFNYTPEVKTEIVNGEKKKFFDDAYVAVTFRRRQLGGVLWDADIEIHREAFCMFPMYDEFGRCIVHTLPECLNEPVIAVTEAAKGRYIDQKMITQLATKISRETDRLTELRCEEI
jgi:hypothetical protein